MKQERIMAENGAHYLEEELKALLQSPGTVELLDTTILDGLWYWDLENPEHEYMSPTFWKTLGFDPSEKEHLAQEWYDLILAEDGAVAQANANRHFTNPEFPYDQIVRYRKKDGKLVTIRCRGQAFFKNGKPVRMLGAHTVVADHQLTKVQAKVAQMVEQSADAILAWTEEGGIETWNEGAQAMFGFSEAAALGQQHLRLTHADFPNGWAAIQAHVDGGQDWVGEVPHRFPDGREMVTLTRISSTQTDDGRTLYLKISRDVTDSVHASAQRDVLLRELNHRVKNLFSVAQAVISFSARGAESTDDMAQLLRARIGALAAAHTVSLHDGPTTPTELYALVEAVLSPYDHGDDTLTISGPEVLISADKITPMGLIIHEFATNAIKHGAWKNGDGKVDVKWDHQKDDGIFRLEWTETPTKAREPTKEPAETNSGFGQLLLENSARQLGGTFEVLQDGRVYCNILTFKT